MHAGYDEVTLRPRGAQVLAVLVVAICIVAEAGFVLRGDPALLLRASPALGLTAVAAWATFWAPRIRIGPADLDLVNVFRTVRVAWPAIEDVETRWGLALVTHRGRFTAWAAPRSSAAASASSLRNDLRRRAAGGGGSRTTASDVGSLAPLLVLSRWTGYRDDGLLRAIEGPGVEVRWHRRTVVVLGLLVVAACAAAIAP